MNIYLNLIRAVLAAEFKGEISSHIAFVPTSVNHAANRDVEAPLWVNFIDTKSKAIFAADVSNENGNSSAVTVSFFWRSSTLLSDPSPVRIIDYCHAMRCFPTQEGYGVGYYVRGGFRVAKAYAKGNDVKKLVQEMRKVSQKFPATM